MSNSTTVPSLTLSAAIGILTPGWVQAAPPPDSTSAEFAPEPPTIASSGDNKLLHLNFGVVGSPYVLKDTRRKNGRTYVGFGVMPEIRLGISLGHTRGRLFGAWRWIGVNTLTNPGNQQELPAKPVSHVEMMASAGFSIRFIDGNLPVKIAVDTLSVSFGWANVRDAHYRGSGDTPLISGFCFAITLHLDALAFHFVDVARKR